MFEPHTNEKMNISKPFFILFIDLFLIYDLYTENAIFQSKNILNNVLRLLRHSPLVMYMVIVLYTQIAQKHICISNT